VLGNTLNRMIFWELVRVFLMSLGTLTGLFLVVGVVDQASRLGLTVGQIVRIIPLLAPSLLPLTIPATTLFASCVVYGRLSHDNEVVALKAAGVHLYHIAKPTLLLGVLTTAVAGSLYHTTIPVTQKRFYEEVLSDPEEVLYNMIRRDRSLRHPSLPYVLYVRDVQGKRLIDVVIKRRVKQKDPATGAEVFTGYGVVARAREAQLHVDLNAGTLSIISDRFVLYDKNAAGSTGQTGPFTMDLPDSVSGKEARQKISTLTWDDLPRAIARVQEELDELLRRRAAHQAEIERISNPKLRSLMQQELGNYKWQVEAKARQLRNVQAEVYARPALAFSCLVFAIIGCPVGIWANRADYLSTFLVSFLPTLLVYYPLLLAGTDMGKNGRVPLAVGCWFADVVMSGIGLTLMWRLLRR
jgi:lipopolysaccharide export system permease protein